MGVCVLILRFLRGSYRGHETAGNFSLAQNESFLLPEDKEERFRHNYLKYKKIILK